MLLTGIHLMRTGEVEANLVRLNQEFRLPYIDELIARKLGGPEQSTLEQTDLPLYQNEYDRLRDVLEDAYQRRTLPRRHRPGAR